DLTILLHTAIRVVRPRSRGEARPRAVLGAGDGRIRDEQGRPGPRAARFFRQSAHGVPEDPPMSRSVSMRHRFSRRRLLSGLGAGTALLGSFLKYRSALAAPAEAGNLII